MVLNRQRCLVINHEYIQARRQLEEMAVSVQTVAASASSRTPPLPPAANKSQCINRLVCTNRKNPKPDLNLGWAKCQTLRCRVWHCPNIACNDALENHVIVYSANF